MFYSARKIIVEILKKDLVGPVEEYEVLNELPTQYYVMGKLYPQNNLSEEVDEARTPLLEAADYYDASISMSNQFNPSSMAITFMLKPKVERILISGGYAFYKPSVVDKKISWQREPYTFGEEISFSGSKIVKLEGGLQIRVCVRSTSINGKMVTIALVNEQKVLNNDAEEIAAACAFQPIIRVEGVDGGEIFSDINLRKSTALNSELRELELLYSDVSCYAQGHGCSAEWDGENPRWVSSKFMPEFNLHQMKPAEIAEDKILSMEYLSRAAVEEIVAGLKNFISEYQRWIDDLRRKIAGVRVNLRDVAQENLSRCQQSHDRILNSIELLQKNAQAFRAFQLANEAMLMQRRQTILKAGGKFEAGKVLWYPFQLAFILQELPSFIEPKCADRQLVDLLWFPTGGGKTEAYLGITTFVIFLRRLRAPESDGVTAFMRYTLRLLTLQQFERASILIFSCEILRKKYRLGGNEISIGLWVGGGLTPNKLDDSRKILRKLQRNEQVSPEESTPYQIKICPWCGGKLNVGDYSVDVEKKRMFIKCRNPLCDFQSAPNGLPVHIIDEAVYANLPTFIVATIDKFAQLPLNDEPAKLFGLTSNKKPPELIIQDELHLISGPLGTITGVYEAAVTKFCERNGIGAKIIASTATIRSASNQIKNLYGKDFSQFPASGFSAKDSFFAVESSPEERPARLYIGVMGIGATSTVTMIRVYGALLFATRYLAAQNFPAEVVDNFWTIVGYFNTLRELGSACTQVIDDVQSRFSYLAKTKFAEKYSGVPIQTYDFFEELTSRKNNSDITKIIQVNLNRRYPSADAYDFILASNMISVGVDVGRLGLMAVANQPKTNSEYIQATSRVGRDNLGLVVTMYNAARSRDRSHYEQFLKYHSAMYSYVEATSLTPFSDRARDKTLQALYVSLCRYLIASLRENSRASSFNPAASEVKKVAEIILDYVARIEPDEVSAVENELEELAQTWAKKISEGFVYKDWANKNKMLLQDEVYDDRFSVMNSMRSVDGQSGIYLLR